MNKSSQHINDLLAAFNHTMLPALAQGNINAFECLTKARIESTDCKMPITFSLGNLFTAIWLWGEQSDIILPDQSNFEKDFITFWKGLTNPWPIKEIEAAGLSVRVVKTSGKKVNHTYELFNT